MPPQYIPSVGIATFARVASWSYLEYTAVCTPMEWSSHPFPCLSALIAASSVSYERLLYLNTALRTSVGILYGPRAWRESAVLNSSSSLNSAVLSEIAVSDFQVLSRWIEKRMSTMFSVRADFSAGCSVTFSNLHKTTKAPRVVVDVPPEFFPLHLPIGS